MRYLSTDGKEIDALEGVDIVRGTQRLGGNKNILFKLLLKFAAAPKLEGSFDELTADGTEALLKFVHTQKGVIGNLSLSPLFEDTVAMESRFKASSIDKAEFEAWQARINDMKDYLREAIVTE